MKNYWLNSGFFHNQCIQTMCRVTIKHTWDHSTPSVDLQQRIGFHPIVYYIFSCQFCWLGHVSKMNFNRLPRRMLSCWVPNKRPIGRPGFTYGKTIMAKQFMAKLCGFDKGKLYGITWHDLGVKKCIWKSLLCPSNFYIGISRSFVAAALAREQTLYTTY